MALGIDEINEKLVESQARIDALVQEQAAGPLSPEKGAELNSLREERIELLNMTSENDAVDFIGGQLVGMLQSALGDNADSGLQKIADMLRGDPSISLQGAMLAVIAEHDESVDATVARECLLATGYNPISDKDFSDISAFRARAIETQSGLDNIAKAISSTVPDGSCAKYLEAKGNLIDLEQSVQKLDDVLSGIKDVQARTPVLQERAGFVSTIEQRMETLRAVGAGAFSGVVRNASPEETMQRFDVARLDDIRVERDEFRLTGDERAALGKQEEYEGLLESIRMQADRDPDSFAAKFISAKDSCDAAQLKADNSNYVLTSERQELRADYLEKFSTLQDIVSEARFFADASKAEQIKNEVERNEVKGDVSQRMDARSIVDFKAMEIAYDRKSDEDFPFAKEILGDKVNSKFNHLEDIAKAAPDSLSAQYVEAKHQIDDKTAEISKLEERYQSLPDNDASRTEILHRIDELKAEIPSLESTLHDIELKAGAIVESTKDDAQVDQDRLIAKVYALDKEIQAGGLDAISLGANSLDIDNYMAEIRAIAKEDPHGSCADFAREYDARRSMDTEVFNARQDAYADRTDIMDSHQEVKSIEVQWSNLQEHVDRLGSEAQICVEGFDTYGRIDTPPDPVDREQHSDTDRQAEKSTDANATQDTEPTAYEKAKADYEAVKDKYNFRNFFVCADRLALNIEAYKTGQPGDRGRPVSGGDIVMNIIELSRTNIFESIIEIKLRDYFDKRYPAKEAQDVEKQQGPTVHKINTQSDAATDINKIFHDDGYIDKKDPRQGVDRGSEQNPGFGRYWGADLTQEARGRNNDISTVIRNCGRGFTDSVVVDGKMETIKIPPIRLVEMGSDHYLIDPFGKTLYSNVTTDSKDFDIQQSYSKPYFETFDISKGRFNGEMLEAGAAAKGISLDEYKNMLTERCKSDYVDNGLRFFAVHGDYLENNVAMNIHEEIDYTKDKIDFLHGLQLDKEAQLKSITVETPNAEAKAQRLNDEIKVAKVCQEDLSTKLDALRDRLEKVEDTLDAYRSAAEICRGKEFGDDVKFSAVLRGEVNGQGKLDKVSYGIDTSREERIQDVLDKFDYKYDPDRQPVEVEQKVEDNAKIDPAERDAKRDELIKEYGYDAEKIKSMDYAVEKLGIEKAEQNYSPKEWADYMLYRDDMDAFLKDKEAEIEKAEQEPERVTQDDRPQEVSKDAGEATADTKPEVAESDKKVDAQATDSPVEKPNQEAESSTDRDKIESREQSEKDSSKGGKPDVEVKRPDIEVQRPNLDAAKVIGEDIGIDGNKLMAMDALLNAYGPDIRETTDLAWDKYDEFIERFAIENGIDPADFYDGSGIDESEFKDDFGGLIKDSLEAQAETMEPPPDIDIKAIVERANADTPTDEQGPDVDSSGKEEPEKPENQVETPAITDGDTKEPAVDIEDMNSTRGAEHIVEGNKDDLDADENEKSFDVAAVSEGEKQLDNTADDKGIEWTHGEIKDYGDVVYVDGFCMNHEQLEEYLKGPMSQEEISEVIDRYIEAGHDSEDSFSFRDDFLEPSKFRVDISDVIDAYADKLRDIQEGIDNGEPPSQDTIDMMVDCLCAIRDATIDDFTESISNVLDRIDEIFISEPGIGGAIADKYMDSVIEMAEPVLSGFHAYDTEQANLVDIVSDRLEMYQCKWDNADVSGFVDATMELNAVFNGFAEMLTSVGNEFSGVGIENTAMDLDTGLETQPMDSAIPADDGLDYLQPEFADAVPDDMPEEPPAAQADVFDPALYDTDAETGPEIDTQTGEDGLDDLDKAADSLNDLGDMLRGIESLSDTMSDLDRDDYMNYLGGE